MDACPAFYIGVTKDPTARFAAHRSELKWLKHGSHAFQKAWTESRSTKLYMEILEEASDEEAMAKEVKLLRQHSSDPNLKNTCVNSAKGISIERLIDPEGARLKKTRASSGEKNPMYGKKHTPEARKKMSLSLKGKTLGYKYGPMSEETKRKLSESKRGKYLGEKNPFYGKKHRPESLEKMRAWDRGNNNLTFVKPVEVDGVVYKSRADACRALNIAQALMTYRLKHPVRYPTYKSLDTDN